MAGMPSFGGPPDWNSASGTRCLEKSVFHSPTVGGTGGARSGAALGELVRVPSQPATTRASATGTSASRDRRSRTLIVLSMRRRPRQIHPIEPAPLALEQELDDV